MFVMVLVVVGLVLLLGSLGAILVKGAKLVVVGIAAMAAWSLLAGSAGLFFGLAVAALLALLARRDLQGGYHALRANPALAISVPLGWAVSSVGVGLIVVAGLSLAQEGQGAGVSVAAPAAAAALLMGLGQWTMRCPLQRNPLRFVGGLPTELLRHGPRVLGLTWGEVAVVFRAATVSAVIPIALLGSLAEHVRLAPGMWPLAVVGLGWSLRYAVLALPAHRFERRCEQLREIHRAEVAETMNRYAQTGAAF